MPYKTLLKILNRLENEGLLSSVSKDIYFAGNNIIDEDRILSKYIDDGKGMVVAYNLFNNVGLSTYQDSRIEIFTNAIKSQQKKERKL